jgi:hypothetical protein
MRSGVPDHNFGSSTKHTPGYALGGALNAVAAERTMQSRGMYAGQFQNTKTSAAAATVKTVSISKSKYSESAAHIEEAQKAGKPSVLTVDREGRRRVALKP